MAIKEDIAEIKTAVNRMSGKLDDLSAQVIHQVAICGPAREQLGEVRRTVYGHNGDAGLKTKVTKLETVSGLRSKGFWALVGLISAIVSGTAVAVAKVIMVF